MSNPFERQWISRLSLEECRKRLVMEHEEATFWATRYQRRTAVKVWQVDSNLVGFEVRRVPKSWLQFDMSNGIKAQGILQRHMDGTQVFVEAKISPLAQGFYYIFLLIFWGALSTVIRSYLLTQPLVMTVLASGGLLILLLILSFFWLDFERRRLLRIVETALLK